MPAAQQARPQHRDLLQVVHLQEWMLQQKLQAQTQTLQEQQALWLRQAMATKALIPLEQQAPPQQVLAQELEQAMVQLQAWEQRLVNAEAARQRLAQPQVP